MRKSSAALTKAVLDLTGLDLLPKAAAQTLAHPLVTSVGAGVVVLSEEIDHMPLLDDVEIVAEVTAVKARAQKALLAAPTRSFKFMKDTVDRAVKGSVRAPVSKLALSRMATAEEWVDDETLCVVFTCVGCYLCSCKFLFTGLGNHPPTLSLISAGHFWCRDYLTAALPVCFEDVSTMACLTFTFLLNKLSRFRTPRTSYELAVMVGKFVQRWKWMKPEGNPLEQRCILLPHNVGGVHWVLLVAVPRTREVCFHV
jgi:hypothetical protein